MRRLSSREVYANPWMTLTEDEIERRDGSTGHYAVVHSPDFVLVIPYDGARYHLVEQYRYPVGARFWEFPQGAVRTADPLTPEEMAAIELAEETGLRARRLARLGFLHDGYGRSTNGFHVLLATELTPGPAHREPEEQDMRTAAFTLDEIWDMIRDGRLTDAASVAALALLERHGHPPDAAATR